MKNLVYLGVILMLTLSACSIEKRVYNSGYHISWNSKQKSIKEVKALSNEDIVGNKKIESNDVEIEKSENLIDKNEVLLAKTNENESFIIKNESPSFVNSIFKNEKEDKSEIKNLEATNKIQTIKKIAKIKSLQSKKSVDLEDLILKLLLIILILILIGLLLSLLGGLLGSLLSLLLFLVLLYLILKILGVI